MRALNVPALRDSATLAVVANAIFFNISWFVIVITHSPIIGPAQALMHLLLHFWLIGRGTSEVRLIGVVVAIGLVIDQLLFASGVLVVAGAAAAAPIWLSCLWPVFATTLSHAFRSFQQRTALAVLFGAVGGAGSYVAGARLSDVEFAAPLAGTLILAAIWGVLFPLLLKLAARWVPGDADAR